MASKASKLVDKLTNILLGGLTNELGDGDVLDTCSLLFVDGGQGGRGGGYGKWCRKFVKFSYVCYT